MSSISQVADALKRVLTTSAKELERETDFVQRSTAQLDGPIFVQTTVFGWMDNAEASYPQLRHVAASLGEWSQRRCCGRYCRRRWEKCCAVRRARRSC
jgi:hypothetical protein